VELGDKKLQDTPVIFQLEYLIIPFIFKDIKQKTALCFPVFLCGSEVCFVTVRGDTLQAHENSAQENKLR
jgi:hypothetical protein